MILPSQHVEVVRLLAAGELNKKQIARQTGLSRTTIWNIANGRRVIRKVTIDSDEPEDEDGFLEPSYHPPRRCRRCGGLVYPPCRLCHIRSLPGRCGPG